MDESGSTSTWRRVHNPAPDSPAAKSAQVALALGDGFLSMATSALRPFFELKARSNKHLGLGDIAAAATILALAAEIYLKSMRTALNLGEKRGHDLVDVFDSLPTELCEDIERRFNELMAMTDSETVSVFELVTWTGPGAAPGPPPEFLNTKPPDHSLREVLLQSRNAFVSWRYIYELGESNRFVHVRMEIHRLWLFCRALRSVLTQAPSDPCLLQEPANHALRTPAVAAGGKDQNVTDQHAPGSDGGTPDEYQHTVVADALMEFSVYSSIQVEKINAVGDEILAHLPDAYGSFWLWVLGAYEILRTMCQANDCFSEGTQVRLKALKADLWILRVPFAKQEMPGRVVPVAAEPSIAGVGPGQDDLIFIVGTRRISARAIIRDFRETMSGIRPEDVRKDHRQSETFQPGRKGGR